MSEYPQPDQAAAALADIRQRQQHVIDAVLVPPWHWWVVAAGMVAIGVAADAGRPASSSLPGSRAGGPR